MCSLPDVFSQILKDEINANDEKRLFNGFKRIIKKHSHNKKEFEVIDEMIRILCGGASINEILHVTRDECLDPTLEIDITVDKRCEN